MYLKNIRKGFLPLITIVGLFKITGIDAAGNQKVYAENKQTIETYDYSDEADVANGETSIPKSTVKPYFESSSITVYATKDVENITIECLPTNFNDSKHQILWYKDENPITNGNTSLSLGKYAVDNKYRLTIINYNKNVAGNFSCAVLPTDIRQYVSIEFGSPPENISTQQSDASTNMIVKAGVILAALIAIVSTNYCKF